MWGRMVHSSRNKLAWRACRKLPPAIAASPSFYSINGPEQTAAMREENASQISGQLLAPDGPLQLRRQERVKSGEVFD